MELKFDAFEQKMEQMERFNRTFMELKCRVDSTDEMRDKF